MTAASTLVSDDPYATATRLLQVGAGLSMREAGTLLSNRRYDEVVALAAQADSDESAVEVIDRLVNTGMDRLTQLDLHIVSDLYWQHCGRWRQ